MKLKKRPQLVFESLRGLFGAKLIKFGPRAENRSPILLNLHGIEMELEIEVPILRGKFLCDRISHALLKFHERFHHVSRSDRLPDRYFSIEDDVEGIGLGAMLDQIVIFLFAHEAELLNDFFHL